jgi:hypothetical protein
LALARSVESGNLSQRRQPVDVGLNMPPQGENMTVNETEVSISAPISRQIRVAIWFEGPQEVEDGAFMFFILSANASQNSVTFFFPDPSDGLTFTSAKNKLDSGGTVYKLGFDVYVFTRHRDDGRLESPLFSTISVRVSIPQHIVWSHLRRY